MLQSYFLFFVGFFILVKCADILVKGASSFAKLLGISSWLIGVVIAGIGTSIPELSITLFSAYKGETDVGLGTVIGSNTFNIFFILGFVALIFPLKLEPEWVKRDLPPNILAVLAAAFLAIYPLVGDTSYSGITRPEGLILLCLFFIWLFYVLLRRQEIEKDKTAPKLLTIPIAVFMIGAGLIGIIVGGKWVVDGAITIARLFGVSEALIGLTIVAIGSSLPELVVSAVAAWRKNPGLSVGNIIGSNVFDFLGILGVASAFRFLPFSSGLTFDILATSSAAILLFLSMFVGRRYIISRWHGALFVLAYFLYFGFILSRG